MFKVGDYVTHSGAIVWVIVFIDANKAIVEGINSFRYDPTTIVLDKQIDPPRLATTEEIATAIAERIGVV